MSLPRVRISTFLAITLVVASLVWLGRSSDRWGTSYFFSGEQKDYSNLLVDGFLKGQLSMDAEVHPDLLSADLATRRAAPFLLDASLYQGKYYLYFGVVPPLLTLLPYTWATGHHLSLNVVTVLYCVLGYLALARILICAREKYFAELGGVSNFVLLVFLGLGTGLPFLVVRSSMYEFTIAGAYLFVNCALLALFRAWHSDKPSRPLALTSLCLGLAVGCRPNFGVLLPFFFFVAWSIQRRSAKESWPAFRDTLLATLVPAGVVGVGLAAYNYLRFGSILEFGFNYQLAPLLSGGFPLAKASFFWPNLKWYYLTPPCLNEFFPFVLPIDASDRPVDYYGWEDVHGHFLTVVAALAVGILGLASQVKRDSTARHLRLSFNGFVFLFSIISFVALGFFCSRASRYTVDFNTALTLWVALVAGPILAHNVGGPAVLRRTLLGLLLVIASFDFLGGIQSIRVFEFTRPETYATLARWGNFPSYWAYKLGLTHFGPIRFEGKLDLQTARSKQTLITTGSAQRTDSLWSDALLGPNVTTLALEHQGYGELPSDPIPFTPGKTYSFEVDMGSLYPPPQHPFFDSWKTEDIERLRTTFRVLMDGKVVHAGLSGFHAAPTHTVKLPGATIAADHPAYISIGNVKRLPPREISTLLAFSEVGVWRARIQLKGHPFRVGAPLLASGVTGRGNLVTLWLFSDSEAKLGLDQWGAGLTMSDAFPFDHLSSHIVEIFVGPQVAKSARQKEWAFAADLIASHANQIRVWIDGKLIWTTTVSANLESYDFTQMGSNRQGFSSGSTFLTGETERLEMSKEDIQKFIESNLALP